MHFGQRHSQLLPFCEYVFAPGKSPVKVQAEILDIFLLRKVYFVYVDLGGVGAGVSSSGECDVDQLAFISFYPPSLYPFLYCIQVGEWRLLGCYAMWLLF
jgi:hypothetical protein